MKKIFALFLFTVALSFSASAQTNEDKEAVKAAALDYIEPPIS
jgi:predicted acyltransferase